MSHCVYNAQGQLVCHKVQDVVETFIEEKPNDVKKVVDPFASARGLLEANMFCQAVLVRDPKTGKVVVKEFIKDCGAPSAASQPASYDVYE